MSATKQANANNAEAVLINIEKVSQTVDQEGIQALVGVIDREVGNRKLEKEEIEQLQAMMSVEGLEAAKWKNAADVLKYISIFAIAENNPDRIKKIVETLLVIVGFFYPIANKAQEVLARVPTSMFAALIKIGGFISPEYLLYRGINSVAYKKSEAAKAKSEQDTRVDENRDTLIIVCKNTMLGTEMEKLVNLEDDHDESIVGVKDGSVHTIIWNEAAWVAFRDKLTPNDRVLIVGKLKKSMQLASEHTRFEQFGVKYGWSDNIAILEAEPNALRNRKKYTDFLSALNSMQLSDGPQKDVKLKLSWSTAGKLAFLPPLLVGDAIRESRAIKEQQLLFGIYSFYTQHLAEFMLS